MEIPRGSAKREDYDLDILLARADPKDLEVSMINDCEIERSNGRITIRFKSGHRLVLEHHLSDDTIDALFTESDGKTLSDSYCLAIVHSEHTD